MKISLPQATVDLLGREKKSKALILTHEAHVVQDKNGVLSASETCTRGVSQNILQ